jgi:hypothetical protein
MFKFITKPFSAVAAWLRARRMKAAIKRQQRLVTKTTKRKNKLGVKLSNSRLTKTSVLIKAEKAGAVIYPNDLRPAKSFFDAANLYLVTEIAEYTYRIAASNAQPSADDLIASNAIDLRLKTMVNQYQTMIDTLNWEKDRGLYKKLRTKIAYLNANLSERKIVLDRLIGGEKTEFEPLPRAA